MFSRSAAPRVTGGEPSKEIGSFDNPVLTDD
jgi:hypothetical protein